MWLVHSSGEEGWHISQANQQKPCDLLVFVRTNTNSWKVKLWKNTETRIRAKNHEEERQDMAAIRSTGFLLGNAQIQTQPQAQEQPQDSGIWSRISSAVSGLGRIVGLNR
jgi:hypothetical protein